MLRLVILILATTIPINGRLFNNPVLEEGDLSGPSVIETANAYYLVTSTNNSLPEKFPIYESTDLNNWKLTGYIFKEVNIPRWANAVQPFLAPRIYTIGNNYHVYFTATEIETNRLSIGVAIAPNPAGPYTATDRPLLTDPKNNVEDPAIIEEKDEIYLIWVTSNSIKGRKLNSNGLSFYSSFSTELISSLSNSTTSLHGPIHTYQGNHYLIYTLRNSSGEFLHAVTGPYSMGPYDINQVSFTDTSDNYKGVGHPSFVKDGTNDVIIYDSYRQNEGPDFRRVIRMATVSWPDLLNVPEPPREERHQNSHYYNHYG